MGTVHGYLASPTSPNDDDADEMAARKELEALRLRFEETNRELADTRSRLTKSLLTIQELSVGGQVVSDGAPLRPNLKQWYEAAFSTARVNVVVMFGEDDDRTRDAAVDQITTEVVLSLYEDILDHFNAEMEKLTKWLALPEAAGKGDRLGTLFGVVRNLWRAFSGKTWDKIPKLDGVVEGFIDNAIQRGKVALYREPADAPSEFDTRMRKFLAALVPVFWHMILSTPRLILFCPNKFSKEECTRVSDGDKVNELVSKTLMPGIREINPDGSLGQVVTKAIVYTDVFPPVKAKQPT